MPVAIDLRSGEPMRWFAQLRPSWFWRSYATTLGMSAVWQLDAEVETALWQAARAEIGARIDDARWLHAAIADRARRYTSERHALTAPRDRLADLAARAVFYTVADAPKATWVCAELLGRTGWLQPADGAAAPPFVVLDVGAGCGAMALGVLAFWQRSGLRRPLRFVLVERDAQALRIAQAAVRAAAALAPALQVEVQGLGADLAQVALPQADLVIAGTVVNELPSTIAASRVNASALPASPAPTVAPQQVRFVEQLLQAAGATGVVMIIEPALRETARALHQLRDTLVATKNVTVLAPCPMGVATCGALRRTTDWCHEAQRTQLPPKAAALAQVTHLRDGDLLFAYVVLGGAALAAQLAPLRGVRLVSPVRGPKGKFEATACTPQGWQTVRLLRRHKHRDNEAFVAAARGDMVEVVTAAQADAGLATSAASDAIEISATDHVKVFTVAPLNAAQKGRAQ